ncbi:MAG: hypothetical protein H7321_02610 [Bacteroidia bacterium]|nr:hypothetical protein [Bacteroidia bacterium]
MKKKGEKQIIDSISNSEKIKLMQDKIKELERLVQQKQIVIDVTNKMIELTEQEHKITITKNRKNDLI